jgi:hypothetical protein
MTSKIFAAVSAIVLLGALGCQHSNVDAHWGEAYREILARQTADPEGAAANAGEPAPQGFDGATAEGVVKKYRGVGGEPGPSLPLPMIVTDTDSAGRR